MIRSIADYLTVGAVKTMPVFHHGRDKSESDIALTKHDVQLWSVRQVVEEGHKMAQSG